MKITVKKLSELHKPAHNIRRHSEKQLTEYIRSIEMFGQVKPLVVAEDGEIIAGNGLYEALLRMGRETCDCYVMVGLTDVQKKKLMMADNKVYELGFTDVDAIEELVKAWLSTTVPDCMYYEATYDGDKKELRLDAYRKIQSVSIPC